MVAKPKRGPGKPFEKGRSGNPAGRPKEMHAFAAELRKQLKPDDAPYFMRKLRERIESDDERVSLDALKYAMDRFAGKALQTVDLGSSELTPEQRTERIAALLMPYLTKGAK